MPGGSDVIVNGVGCSEHFVGVTPEYLGREKQQAKLIWKRNTTSETNVKRKNSDMEYKI